MGARGVLTKPVKTRDVLDDTFERLVQFVAFPTRRVLVADADEARRKEVEAVVSGDDVVVHHAATGADALAILAKQGAEVLVLGLDFPDMRIVELVDRLGIDGLEEIPIIVYAPRGLETRTEAQITRLAQTHVLKEVRSPERLFDETALYLHRVVADLPDDKRQVLERLHHANTVLAGKRALIVDDDIRNIFAMMTILERHEMQCASAETGKAAIEILEATPEVDVVLMDIMMPEMDGYDTIRAIRELENFSTVPIIAVTAKAMKGDREKCFEAGASDYISKPVDPEQLLAMLRVWLHR
jgi:CheY-like chemotaxis protein